MIKRKLTLMKPYELRKYREHWCRRMSQCKTGSASWKICKWMIDRIEQEIKFKVWLKESLEKLEGNGVRH